MKNLILTVNFIGIFLMFANLDVKSQCIEPVFTSIGNSGPSCEGGTISLNASGEIGGVSSSYIRMAGIGGNYGRREFNALFASGDRPGAIERITTNQFNSIAAGGASALRDRYDVLLFTWASPNNLNVSWSLINEYLSLGGSVFWEDNVNIGKLNSGVSGVGFDGSYGNNYTLVTPSPFPELVANGVVGYFSNHHLRVTSWPSWMSPYIVSPAGGAYTLAIAGVHPSGGGRLIVQGPDQDYHAVRGGGNPGGNQYKMLLNQLDFLIAEQTGIAWSGPNGFTSNEANPVLKNVSLAMAGTYTATLTNVTGGGCSVLATTDVVIYPNPTVSLGGDLEICTATVEVTAFVEGGTQPYNYLWSNGSKVATVALPPGNHSVVVTDANGCNSISDNITIIEGDVNPPVALVKNISVSLDASGNASITADQIDNGSTDDCGIQSISIDKSAFDCSSIGDNTVILTVTDKKGNVSSAKSIVTIVDDIAPSLVPKILEINLNEIGVASIEPTQLIDTSGDNCSVITISLNKSDFSCDNVGENEILLTAIDPSGNSFSTSSIVIVKDPIAPEVLTKSITLELDASGKGTITSADIDNGSSDVCGIASLSLDKVSFDCSNIGDNVVSLTATDNNGNLTSASAMVTVVDLVAPEVFTKNITLELDASGKGTITSADIDNGSSDACGIASLSLDKVNFDCSNIGDNVVSLTVTDIFGNSSVETALVTITNETPVINSVSIPVDPQQINTNIVASVDFTDINISSSEISWGDGTSNAMEIVDNTMISSHGYSIPGVYTISILVTDICGQSASYEYQYVVIYDPSGGFVSGGGWINSLPGYFTPDPSLSGKATFGFVAKYKKGTNIPEGNTQFKFNSAGFQFESEAYDWLVVAGNRAKYKGNGMVNGVSGYFFLLTATDASDRSEVDRFRIKIWDSNDAVIYDNQPGAANDADTTNEIGGGSITVHDGKKSDNSSRIDLNNTLQVSVYPNPASSDLTLEVSNELIDLNPDYTISIFDVNGLIIYNRNYNGNIDSRINIDISKFSSGTYIIQFNNSKTNQLYKFFKQ